MQIKNNSSKFQLGALMAPGLLIFALFTIYPIFRLLIASFHDWTLASMVKQPFVGWNNYKTVFSDKTFWISFENSIVYALVTVPGQMFLGLLVAILIDGIRYLLIFIDYHLLHNKTFFIG